MISLIRKSRNKSASKRPTCEHQTQLDRDHQHKELVGNSDSSQYKAPDDNNQTTSPSVPLNAKGKCTACVGEKSAKRKYRWKIIAGLIFPFALQALDVTMLVPQRTTNVWLSTEY